MRFVLIDYVQRPGNETPPASAILPPANQMEGLSTRVEPVISTTRATTRVSEQRFFMFMSVLLFATALVGFGANTLAIVAGSRAVRTPTLLFNAHATLMFAWLLLLVVQTSLNAAGQRGLHKRLGQIAFVLVPVITVVMILVSTINLWVRPEWPPQRYNVLLLQFRAIMLFPFFVGWALLARRSSLGTHKRLMIIGTAVLLDAAITRIPWLPGGGARNRGYEVMSAYQVLLLTPLIVHDLRTTGRLHRATMIGVGLFAVSTVMLNALWGSEWWIQAAPRLLHIGVVN